MSATGSARSGTTLVISMLAAALAVTAIDLVGRPRSPAALPSATVDLNTADAAELTLLPGVGPRLAERIVENRSALGPFASVDELQRVPGIGPRTVEHAAEIARAR